MKFGLLVIAFCSILAFPAKPVVAEEFRIGAWNIEWLGFPEKRGKPGKDVSQDPVDLANYIAEANLDVLSLEEIGVDKSSAPWNSKPLDEILKNLKEKHSQSWQYILFGKADYPSDTEDFIVRGQHIGLAWRTDRAKLVGEPFAIPTGFNDIYGIKFWERRANAVKLSFGEGKTDMVFVPVHLKSNRNDANGDATFTQKQRQAETQVFADKLQALKSHFQDQDIVLLGDTNILGPEEQTSKPLIDAGLIDLNQSNEGTTAVWGKGYSSAPFDRIFIPANQPEFSKSQQKVHKTKNGTDDEIKNFKKRFSDHYMISIAIEVAIDDD